MKTLSGKIIKFFRKQNFVIVSTIDSAGHPHSSCKGIIDISPDGKIYLLDLYIGNTYKNLKKNSHISIAAVDEHKFVGYCLKGKARLSENNKIKSDILKTWKDKVAARVTHRIIKKIHGERGHPRHPEILFPNPRYMIVMDVEEIIDLTPSHLK